jgi:hypothetical protein
MDLFDYKIDSVNTSLLHCKDEAYIKLIHLCFNSMFTAVEAVAVIRSITAHYNNQPLTSNMLTKEEIANFLIKRDFPPVASIPPLLLIVEIQKDGKLQLTPSENHSKASKKQQNLSELMEKLNSTNQWDRMEAARAIGQLPKVDQTTMLAIVDLLGDDAAIVLREACQAIGNLGTPGDQRLIKLLLPHLSHKHPEVAAWCAISLGKLGYAEVAQALFGLLQFQDQSIRREAGRALYVVCSFQDE